LAAIAHGERFSPLVAVAGFPIEARFRASSSAVAEVCMDTLLQDLRLAKRSLASHPGFTAVVVATLALGIGATTAIFSIANAVLLRSLPFPDASRLVVIWGDRPQSGYPQLPLSLPNFVDLRERSRSFDDLAVWTSFADTKLDLGGAGDPQKVQYAIGSASLFSMLGVTPVRGRLFSPDDDLRGRAGGVLVSERLWSRVLAPNGGIEGATIMLDGSAVRVVGVLPSSFRFVSFPREPDVWLPLGLDPSAGREYARGAASLGVLGRLAPGVTLDGAQREIAAIAADLAREYPAFNRGWTLTALPLQEQSVAGARPAILAMLGAVAIVLLIACANVANLLMTRAVARRRELAVRAALGAGRTRLVRQLLTESAFIAVLGGVFGILLAAWLVDVPAAVAFMAPSMFVPYQAGLDAITLDSRVLAFTAVLTIVTTLVVGLVPAFRAARLDPADSLRDVAGGTDRARRMGSTLVVLEIALSVTLLAGAGLLLRSFDRLLNVDPGFRAEQVLTVDINLPSSRYQDGARAGVFFASLVERIQALPGVRAAGAIEQLPFSGPTQSTDFRIIGEAEPLPGQAPQTPYGAATPDYFRAMSIPLVRGRKLERADDDRAAKVVVINEAFARRFFPNDDALGQKISLSVEALRFDRPNSPPRLDFPDAAREIIGIVADVRQQSAGEAAAPMAYIPLSQRPSRDMTLTVLVAGEPLALVPAIRAEVAGLDPLQPLTAVAPMRQVVAASLAEPRARTRLATIFAAIAIALTSIGIYGVISYGVARRRHEIGIRMALGAGRRKVVMLVVREGLTLAIIGTVIGAAGALMATRALGGMLFGIEPTDGATYAGVVTLVLGVAVAASWIPARRASKVDPIEALRAE
jgi:putative ABC transport system permease protein